MTRHAEVAVIGAGIGGLAAAIALQRAGLRPRVFEQAAQLTEIGAGISLSPNAVKGLQWLGVAERLVHRADTPPQQVTCHYATGAPLITIDRSDTIARYGAPYWQAHRADLQAALVAQLSESDPRAIATNKLLMRIRVDGEIAQLEFADGTNTMATAVLGADGSKSRVRADVFGVDAPAFAGFVAWRGLVPRDRLRGVALSPGSAVSIAPGRLFVRYPVRHGAQLNFVAFERSDIAQHESWSKRGATQTLRERFHDFHAETRAILAAFPDTECHRWGLYAREPLDNWARGTIALLGDAAHPMLPWFGQGAASAIEDAVVLGRCAARAATLREAFADYSAARLERVTTIHRESLLGGERLTGARPELMATAPARNEDSLGIFAYDPATVPLPSAGITS
jgi:salicylate hydroxylase